MSGARRYVCGGIRATADGSRLSSSVVEISVKEGFVTLNGKVDTPLDRDAARVAAEAFPA
ncbi:MULTISPECIES: BON domain-containing protein [unclassified Rhizobium]|uniref:BON domain-containing protein n=1 Tax=unclassified Rhizobium TaxID=2613769 RepID=UPI001608339F